MPEFDEDVWVAALDARLDALPGSPTSTDVMHVTDDYEASTGVAVAVRRALEGGGSLPDEWTDGGNGNVTAAADPTFVPLTIEQSDELTSALELKAAAGATALATHLLTVYDDTGTAVGDIDAEGNLFLYDGAAVRVQLHHQGQISVNALAGLPAGTFILRARSNDGADAFRCITPGSGKATTITSVAAGDTALEIGSFDEDSDAINLIGAPDYNGGEFRVWGDGKFSTKAHTAPADGNIVAGECVFWFDQTDGAAKFKMKAKTADGTVVASEVALA